MRRLPVPATLFIVVISLCPAGGKAGQGRKDPLNDPARIGRRDITKGGMDFYSPQAAIEMGDRMAREVEDLTVIYDDPATAAFVQRVTDRIVRHSDAKLPVHAELILSEEVDAFALPGGHLFLTTGLRLKTRTEAELAGVIAHEVAHIAARDATRKMSEERMWNWMSLPILMFGGPTAFTLEEGVAGPLAMTAFSRTAERRADRFGLQYLYESGYDPEGFINFFERAKELEKDPEGRIARAFSSHPLTKDRVAAAEKEIERYLSARDEYLITTSEYEGIKLRLEEFMHDQMPLVTSEPATPVLHGKAKGSHFRAGERR